MQDSMHDKGLVSIIMPSYNCGQFVEESIHSVQAQTYLNWELVFVDDCSEDDTLEKVMSLREHDSRIRVFESTRHCGAAVARNTALLNARGRWIAFLDSDDVWEPTKLERQLSFMEENNYHFSCHKYIEIDESSNDIGVLVSCKTHFNKRDLMACCWPGCLTVMYDSAFVGVIQICDIKMNNDTAMWLKVAEKTDCYLLEEPLARYRRRKNSITRRNRLERVLGHYALFREAERMNPFSAVFWMCINIIGNAYKKIRFVDYYNVG